MSLTNIMGLLGGLALFLYGMQMMSNGLELAARNQMRDIMKKITSNRIIGVLTGALITAVIQSSSATTVMVVGFVNSGIMTLEQATWIIMGANIGTTITGQLIALDVGAIAPLFAFIGVAAVVFQKNEKLKHFGEILAGLGVLFIGMTMMSSSMEPLANQPAFINILAKVQNPIVGILMGMIFTAIIQSSSASVGILQALAASGVIGLNSAAFILFGQNIGTCITALLASIGTTTNAKRTTLIHIMFNVFGTIIFTILCLITPIISIIQSITPTAVPSQIANLHTLFNIVTTLLLLPVGTMLPKIASLILRESKNEASGENGMSVKYLLDPKNVHTETTMISVICIEGIRNEILRMTEMAKENIHDSFDVFMHGDIKKYEKVENREEYVDFLNKEISRYITNAITHEATKAGSQIFNSFYTITSNIERISDHAINIAGYSKMIEEKNISFSDNANTEIDEIKDICDKTMDMLLQKPDNIIKWHENVICMEQKIDDMTVQFRNNMYERIQKGLCTDEGSILFSEMLTDFERVGDHALNISNEMLKITMKEIV
ncbi:MAG: Na/Pi cotransporter family protein [Christensenellales bacterium]